MFWFCGNAYIFTKESWIFGYVFTNFFTFWILRILSHVSVIHTVDNGIFQHGKLVPSVDNNLTVPEDTRCLHFAHDYLENFVIEDTYLSYLMFCPDPSSVNVWVPLKAIEWKIEAKGFQNSDGTWDCQGTHTNMGTRLPDKRPLEWRENVTNYATVWLYGAEPK